VVRTVVVAPPIVTTYVLALTMPLLKVAMLTTDVVGRIVTADAGQGNARTGDCGHRGQ
jgi:hypothetical protein